MATFLNSPMSLISVQDTQPRLWSFTSDTTYLSRPAKPMPTKKPETYIPTAFYSSNVSLNTLTNAESGPNAPTTRRQSNQQNYALYQMLRNIEAELTSQRSILLELRSRVSYLEKKSNPEYQCDATPIARTQTNDYQVQSKHASNQYARVSRAWWEACQNFARNCDTPFDADELLGRQRRFSGFDFNFDTRRSKTPPSSPIPKINEVPAQSSPAELHASPLPETSASRQVVFSYLHSRRAQDLQPGDDIVEHIVNIDEERVPIPPKLQSPPQSRKSASTSASLEEITALPVVPVRSASQMIREKAPQGCLKKLKHAFNCKGLFAKKKYD